jgi:two-component system, response regulator PdtaR
MQKVPRVLIVEDHAITALSLEKILREIGCEPTGCVGSGEEAIEAAEQHRPDLVLMDVELKGPLNGIETAAEIKRRFGIPSVFLSGYGDSETRARARRAEPLAFIDKTAPLPKLTELLRDTLKIVGF